MCKTKLKKLDIRYTTLARYKNVYLSIGEMMMIEFN